MLDLPEELYHRIAHQKFKEGEGESLFYGPDKTTDNIWGGKKNTVCKIYFALSRSQAFTTSSFSSVSSYVVPAAIREVMAYQSGRCGPKSVTSLPATQHGGTSVTPNTQQLVHSFTDDLQVCQISNLKAPYHTYFQIITFCPGLR